MGRGRKNVYSSKIKSRFDEIAEWVKNGATERSIAEMLGVSYSTFNKYKAEKDEFSELLKKSREVTVDKIESAMFDSAIGFTKKVKKHMKCKRVEYDNGKRVKEEEVMVPYEEETYFPPNTKAAIYLLKHWGKDRGYTNDPMSIDLKKREIDLKEKVANANNWLD